LPLSGIGQWQCAIPRKCIVPPASALIVFPVGADSFGRSKRVLGGWGSVVATTIGPNRFPASAADEIFYSGDQFNRVTVRAGQTRRLLNPASDMDRGPGLEGAGPKNGKLSDGLCYALLADALDNDARALRLHHAFRHRVGSILPDRWTLSRSRIRAYADMIEQYQEVGIDAGVDPEAE
jgi:hypothetical protein